MKKKTFLRLCMISFFSGLFIFAKAQEWNYINEYRGVSVYWRARIEPYASKYITELKLENNNSYRVKIQFKARFVCSEGNEFISTTNGITIGANSTKAGQFAGLWWYPCGENNRPRNGGYRDMEVSNADN